MDTFRQHEIFEIEVLEQMKNSSALDPLVFGGGTMLRLCHELPRYSVDLDFWFVKSVSQDVYYKNFLNNFKKIYEITDSQIKHFTILFELRTKEYPRRLKIEIRKGIEACDFQEMIAFSRFASKQVALKAHTLDQTMRNKISAFLDRGEVRDCFDIEFLLRRGTELPLETTGKIETLLKIIDGFTKNDFKVKLGSILDAEFREYYVANRFGFLKEKLSAMSDRG